MNDFYWGYYLSVLHQNNRFYFSWGIEWNIMVFSGIECHPWPGYILWRDGLVGGAGHGAHCTATYEQEGSRPRPHRAIPGVRGRPQTWGRRRGVSHASAGECQVRALVFISSSKPCGDVVIFKCFYVRLNFISCVILFLFVVMDSRVRENLEIRLIPVWYMVLFHAGGLTMVWKGTKNFRSALSRSYPPHFLHTLVNKSTTQPYIPDCL